jgi:hypothetical protein
VSVHEVLEDNETGLRRAVWPILVAALTLLALFFLVILLREQPARPQLPVPVVTTFQDAGRTCTQVVIPGIAADIDCDYPPAENRLGAFLDS